MGTYYPVPRPENEALADAEPGVTLVGRLTRYRYCNVDQVAATALKAADDVLAARGRLGGPLALGESSGPPLGLRMAGQA